MSETALESWFLRPAQPEDDDFLEHLFYRLHAADFAGLGMPEVQVRGLVQMQARAQRLGYARGFPGARSSIVMAGTEPIGRLLVDYNPAFLRLVDIALLPERQGHGIGTKLLQGLQAEAQERSIPLHLAVQPGNPALRLYNWLGFRIIAGGVQVEMEWLPSSEQPAPQTSAPQDTKEQIPATPPGNVESLAVSFAGLAGRRFRVQDVSLQLTLDRVQRHRASANVSFSLFFQGALEPVLAQGPYTLHLLNSNSEPERELLLFLVPVGPAAGRMEYEAVFNL